MRSKLTGFQAVSLDDTNRMAKMLDRVDTKYVLDEVQYFEFLRLVCEQYAVLEIKGRQEFQYASCYYDDHFSCYHEHHQARRKRVKVRTREYVNSGLIFFEAKLKGLRGRTEKHRVACDSLIMPHIQGEHHSMLVDLYAQHYKMDMPFIFRPALIVRYSRCTLVALQGGERVTIDFDLHFARPDSDSQAAQVGRNFIIVETKSANGDGIADQTMKRLGIRRASKCSKYCIGVNLTGAVTKNNNFLHTIKHVQKNLIPILQDRLVANT